MESSNVIFSLPKNFKSIINESFEIDDDNPRELIEILGNKLCVKDYKTNMITFWLLDIIAYEIIQTRYKMNSKNFDFLISWITGEAKLIQDKRFNRDDFWREMNRIFEIVYKRIVDGRSFLYWEEIDEFYSLSDDIRSIDSLNDDKINNDEEKKDFFKYDDTIIIIIDDEKKISKNLIKDQEREILLSQIEIFESVVESTYKIYGNSFYYSTISAAFFQSTIKFVDYNIPYGFNIPRRFKRSSKIFVPKEIGEKFLESSKKIKGKGRYDLNPVQEIPEIPPPPPSITDEELIKEKRKFILPLMESNEAAKIIEDNSIYQIEVETKKIKKNNRKKPKK